MKKYLIIPLLLLLFTGCKLYDEYEMPEEVEIELIKTISYIFSSYHLERLYHIIDNYII